MFGAAWLTVPILLTLVSIALGVVRLGYTLFFSDSAKWQTMHDWLTERRALYKAEWDRLRSSYTRIDKEPPAEGQDLVDQLNKQFKKRRWRLWLILGLAVLLGGCPLHVWQEPPLPMPARPTISFALVDGRVCLSQADAAELAKYLDKLNAFDAARQRAME